MTVRGKSNGVGQRPSIPAFDNGDPIAAEKAHNNINNHQHQHLHQNGDMCVSDHHQDVLKTDLDRPVLVQQSFNDIYQLERPPKKDLKNGTGDYLRKKCSCDWWSVWHLIQRRIPVLEWLPKYDIHANAFSDLIGGVTVGIMQIPQGMAYALLADMPPVVGLYVSFFSVIVYFLLGTSKHLSLGTFAVVSLMTGNVISSYLSKYGITEAPEANTTSSTFESSTMTSFMATEIDPTTTMFPTSVTTGLPDNELSHNDFIILKVELAAGIAFLVGVIQIGMALLQLGALSVYLSDTLVSGFTTGAAVQVFTSQVKSLLGISVPTYSGVIAIIYTYIDVFSEIQNTNLVTLALSASVIVALLIVNDCINLRFKSRMFMPVPMELIVIVATTLASYYLDLADNYDVVIVGDIPTGIPAPTVPQFSFMGDLVVGSIAISIVSYCIPISLAKIFAKKHRYDVDPNQELFAYGAGNVFGSFFHCFPSCGSLSRSSVQEASGSKTQVCSLISSGLLLIVLLFIAPLFEPVPNCVLSGIIVVALRGMLRQVADLPRIWKVSKSEAVIWLVTFVSVVLLDVEYGLLVAIAFLLIVLLYKLQRPYVTVLGNLPQTDTYLDLRKYKTPKELKGIKIIQFGGPLYFANREYFRRNLYKLVFNPQKEMAKRKKREKKAAKRDDAHSTISSQNLVEEHKRGHDAVLFPEENGSVVIDGVSPADVFESREEEEEGVALPLPPPGTPETLEAIIIDCTTVTFIDTAAMSILSQLVLEFSELGVKLHLTGCRDNVMVKLERTDCIARLSGAIFPSIHEAVLDILHPSVRTINRNMNASTETVATLVAATPDVPRKQSTATSSTSSFPQESSPSVHADEATY